MEERFDDEMRFHVEMLTERYEKGGLPPDEARRAALVAFGGRELFREEARDEYRSRPAEELVRDVRYAARAIRRRPTVVVIVVVTLALGIGALTTVFSVVDGVILRPLPYPEPDRLVALVQRWEGRVAGPTSVSPAEYYDYLDRLRTLDAFGVYTTGAADVSGDGEAERVPDAQVSAGVLEALGTHATLGRLIAAGEDRPGTSDVVMLTDELWRRRYGRSPVIVGQRIIVNGRPVSVVGVLPAGFRLPDEMATSAPAELLRPLALSRDAITIRGSHYLSAVGRLRGNANVHQAISDAASIALDFTSRFPTDYPAQMHFVASAVPLEDTVIGSSRPTLYLLLAAVACVLIIACVNSASLLLAQSESRMREMAVRAALGAARGRLVRQLLVESLVLAGMAGMCGLALAEIGTRALIRLQPVNLPRLAELTLDWRVLGVALAVTLASALSFGLVPALHLVRADVQSALKNDARGMTASRRNREMRRALVVGEIGIAVVLLLGAGLLTKSFARLLAVDPGFTVGNVLTVPISLPPAIYAKDDAVIAVFEQVAARVRTLPGVRGVGAVAGVPLAARRGDIGIDIEGQPRAPGAAHPTADWQVVTPGYIRAIGMRLTRGREIEETDRANSPGAVVVNKTLAGRYWPREEALGRRFVLGGGTKPDTVTVVGVVEDVRQAGLGEVPRPEMYLAHAQFRFWGGGSALLSLTLVIRAAAEPTSLAPLVRREWHAMSPAVPLGPISTMEQLRAASVAQPRFMMLLLLVASALAFVIAVVGVYGVVAYRVVQRRKEFGVRVALGAVEGDITRLVLREAVAVTVAGVAVGVPAALAFARLLRGFLYDVSATDPGLLIAVPACLAAMAMIAAYLPARRAAHLDPVTALRAE